ncbi:uncharacterized protein LOC115726681 isoform X1 [Rhodamnia argentea]|uniref:Uncharacterized protein LOC115726681 isoform X1 n=1 Tax=Rhodamnia argentea TaxID=178133 RepID=A0A8B8MRX9_9MYRT|nr:uncharacterized protein LOC115726681 isoform X1 [Rhodamnia argentea]
MEETITTLSKSLGYFCNHLQSSVDALKQSMDRRPIPLDSSSSTFIQCLNRRVSTASSDLNLLDSMSFGTVSFEELLGHCNEVFKKNQSDLAQLEERLKSFGYVPNVDNDEEDAIDDLSSPIELDPNFPLANGGFDQPSSCSGRLTAAASMTKSFEEDSLFDDSISLKRLGISDLALATIASEANGETVEPNLCLRQPQKYDGSCLRNQEDKMQDLERPYQPATVNLGTSEVEGPKSVVKASKDEYESLPSYMKSLASWEDLLIAIGKINSYLSKKENLLEHKCFFQDEISSLALGPKARSYLLLLTRMNHLVVETVDGLISYRVL